MDVNLRPAAPRDASDAGLILYEAFKTVADEHGFPSDLPSAEVGAGLVGMLIEHPAFYAVVAERDGELLGTNFMDERSIVFGIGPISVYPSAQNAGVGRILMQDALDRAATRNAVGVRLLQAAYHNRSLCLYTTLGFRTREPMSVICGPPPKVSFAGYDVRPAQLADLTACNAICRDVHGFDRGRELKDAIARGDARVVEHLGQISGYTTLMGFLGHSVARTDFDLMALISATTTLQGPGIIVPTRNYRIFSWCLANGMRLVMQMTLMTTGLYNEPAGAYLPSILL
jgi:predicted N-acetyltransferase YhbS